MYSTFDAERAEIIKILHENKALPGYEFNQIDAVAKRGIENKKKLIELLKLPEDLRTTIRVDAPDAIQGSDLYQCLYQFLEFSYRQATEDQQRNMLYSLLQRDEAGRNLMEKVSANMIKLKKREQRFSKFLNKEVDHAKFEDFVKKHYRGLDPRFQRWEPFVSALFELASNMKRDVVISANPLDMILSSEKAGFRSCHSLDGAHANGNIAYAIDKQTIILYMKQPEPKVFPYQKIARMWAYLDLDSERKFVLAKAYGNVGQAQQNEIAQAIGAKLAESLGIENKWDIRSGLKYPTNKIGNKHSGMGAATPIFFDQAISLLCCHTSVAEPSQSKQAEVAPIFMFESAMCLNCGTGTRRTQHMVCDTCFERAPKCSSCRHAVRPGGIHSREHGGKHYCVPCYDQMFFDCKGCNVKHSVNDKRYVQINNQDGTHDRYCEACAETHLFKCSRCELHQPHAVKMEISEPKRTICKSCFDKHGYHTCSDCTKHVYRVIRQLNDKGEVISKRCTPCHSARNTHQSAAPAQV